MNEHPLLCNSQVVRNILDRRQTQDRRPIKRVPKGHHIEQFKNSITGELDWFFIETANPCMTPVYEKIAIKCPYGKPGDILWVRETWKQFCEVFTYRADISDKMLAIHHGTWKPSIHMPKWACRLRLTVKRVWVERVQDIDELGALAEGVEGVRTAHGKLNGVEGDYVDGSARDGFKRLWESIYPGSWDRNDWVWCCEFEVKPK